MPVETIGELHAWMAHSCEVRLGPPRGLEEHAGLLGKAELDLHTLVWTRGAAFPISQLDRCGEGRGQPRALATEAMWWYHNTTPAARFVNNRRVGLSRGAG